MSEASEKTRYFLYTCGRCETMAIVEPHPVAEPIRCPICKKYFILNKEVDEEFAMEYPGLIQRVE